MTEFRRAERPIAWLLVTGILLLAAFFRLYDLHTMPWGLSQDEVGNADISLGLLGGEHAPFLSGGFGHEPLFHYLQAITITLCGDNVIGIRMPAVAAGMLLVAASYALMCRWFGGVAALATATAMALSWWPVIFSRVGIRAVTFPLTLALAVYFLSRAIDPTPRLPAGQSTGSGRPAERGVVHWLLAGFLFGLSYYTYTAARVLPALALAWLVYSAVFQRSMLRLHWRGVLLALGVAVAVAGPLFLYLRAHPELGERIRQLSGPLEALRQGDFVPLWQGIWATLGMFSFDGDARWTYGIPSRPIFEPLSGALFYLGLVVCLARASRLACGMALIWLAVALAPSMVAPDAPSAIRAIGALPVAYGMVGVAVAWLWERAPAWLSRRGGPVQAVLATGLGLLALGNAVWTCREGFGVWAGHPEVYWLYKTHFADIAAFLDDQPIPQPAVVFEAWVDPVDVNGLQRDLIHDERQPRWAQAGRSFIWPAGAGRFTLAMPIFSTADPDVWRLFAGDPPVVSTSPYRMTDGRPGVTFYTVEAEPRLADFLEQASTVPVTLPEGAEAVLLPADFGGQVALLGYQVLDAAAPGGELRLVTAWRILRDGPEPVNVFVHLLDADGNLVAQHDGFDVWAASLRQGDVVAQLHAIPLEAGHPPATDQGASLQVGVYTRADLRRLPVLVDGVAVADRLRLALVEGGT